MPNVLYVSSFSLSFKCPWCWLGTRTRAWDVSLCEAERGRELGLCLAQARRWDRQENKQRASSGPRRFRFGCPWPHPHRVSAGGRGCDREHGLGRHATRSGPSSDRPRTRPLCVARAAGCVPQAGDWRRGTNGAEIWSSSFSQATHPGVSSFSQATHSLSTHGGDSFSFTCQRDAPFLGVFACGRAFARFAQPCVLYVSRVAVPVANLCSRCAPSLNTECLGVCCRRPSPQVGLDGVALLCRDPRGVACLPPSKPDPDSSPAAAGPA